MIWALYSMTVFPPNPTLSASTDYTRKGGRAGCLSAQLSITEYHGLGDLNNRNFFSQFWRLEVFDQGVSMTIFWGELSLGYQWLPLLCVNSHGLNLCMTSGDERALLSLLIRMLILWDQGPTLMTSFHLNYLLRGFVSKYSHTRGGKDFNILIWGGGHKHSVHYRQLEKSTRWFI